MLRGCAFMLLCNFAQSSPYQFIVQVEASTWASPVMLLAHTALKLEPLGQLAPVDTSWIKEVDILMTLINCTSTMSNEHNEHECKARQCWNYSRESCILSVSALIYTVNASIRIGSLKAVVFRWPSCASVRGHQSLDKSYA